MAKVRKNPTKGNCPGNSDMPDKSMEFGLGGLLGKLGGFIEKLGELAETGEQLSKSGEIGGLDPNGKLRGVYGLSIKTGLGEHGQHELKVEPFGNIHRQPSGERMKKDIREPLVDVFEEDDHVLVLAEIPGVSKKDVRPGTSRRSIGSLPPSTATRAIGRKSLCRQYCLRKKCTGSARTES